MNCWRVYQSQYLMKFFKNKNVKKIRLKIEKLEIIKETKSVGIEVIKTKI